MSDALPEFLEGRFREAILKGGVNLYEEKENNE
jgi:hypothetical protein